MCIHRISTVGYRVVNVNGACNRSDTDGCSRRMPLCILVVSSVPRSYTTYVGDTGTVRKLITFSQSRAKRNPESGIQHLLYETTSQGETPPHFYPDKFKY